MKTDCHCFTSLSLELDKVATDLGPLFDEMEKQAWPDFGLDKWPRCKCCGQVVMSSDSAKMAGKRRKKR